MSKLLILLLFAVLAIVSVQAQEATPRAPANVRAVWIRPFMNAGPEIRGDAEKGRAYIRAELERLQKAGFNTIYVETIFDSYTLYPSKILPLRPLAVPYGVADTQGRGWDVLQAYLEAGKSLKISVHAWCEVFFAWHTGLGPIDKSPIFGPHPEWLALNRDGSALVESEAEGPRREVKKVFISPSHRAARAFLVKLYGELATNYPALAGIQLDYIRYPLHWDNAPFDYNPDALRQFKQATGLDARTLAADATPKEWHRWQDWKTQQVTDTVGELVKTMRGANPQLIISAAVFPGFAENLRVKMQDSQDWARRGWVDALLPMLYNRDYAKVEGWAREFRAGIPSTVRVYPALFIGHFYDPATKKVDARYLELPRKLGFDGVGLFAAQAVTDDLAAQLKF